MKFRKTLKEHKAAVYALCQAKEEHKFYSAGSDRHVIQWNLQNFKAEKVVAKAPTTIVSLCFVQEYNYLLIGQVEGGVHIIDLNTSTEIKYLKIHLGYVFDIVYVASKNEVIFSSGDGTVSIWSVPEFKLLFHTRCGRGKNRKMDYSSIYHELAVSSADGFVQVFNTVDWSTKFRIENLESAANSVLYIAENLLIGTKNAHLHRFNKELNKLDKSIPAHNWAIYDLKYNHHLKLLATASRDKTLKIWNVNELQVIKRFEGFKDEGHTHSVNALLWSKFNNYLLSTGDDKTIKVWSLKE